MGLVSSSEDDEERKSDNTYIGPRLPSVPETALRETDKIKCLLCNKEILRRELSDHSKKFHATSSNTTGLSTTLHQKPKVNSRLVKCPVCHEGVSKDKLRNHVLKFHSNMINSPIVKKALQLEQITETCPHCSVEVKRGNLQKHIRKAHYQELKAK